MAKKTIIDSHVHCDSPALIEDGLEALCRYGVSRVAVLSYGHMDPSSPARARGNSNAAVLAAKALFPDRVYAFGGVNHIPGRNLSEEGFAQHLAEQAGIIIETGFDGVKLIETKPSRYASYPFRLHEWVFDGFFGTLEEAGLPVLWHVGDPASFWDPAAAPPWAKEQGWYYGEGLFPTLEQLYAESRMVLERHPKLKVTFAHFYFQSGDLGRLADLFTAFGEVRVDITPGTEMYLDFSNAARQSREFFAEFADRILFGTDIMLRGQTFDEEGAVAKLNWVREFLDTDHAIRYERRGIDLRGLALPEEVRQRVYDLNFRALAGDSPRPLNRRLALEECDRLSELHCSCPSSAAADDLALAAKRLIEGA